jgi:hypothetical protein
MTESEGSMANQDHRRRGKARRAIAIAMALCCSAAPALPAMAQGVAKTTAGDPKASEGNNPYNEDLLKMTPEERAARLARFIGGSCIGSNPFLMGVTKRGRAKGYAYWSLQCAGDKSYLVQLSPDGEAAAMDCETFKKGGEGRECYKAF